MTWSAKKAVYERISLRREEREKYSKRITDDNATGLGFECKIRAQRFHSGEERRQQNSKKIFRLLREVWGPLRWGRGPWAVPNEKGTVSDGRLCAEGKQRPSVLEHLGHTFKKHCSPGCRETLCLISACAGAPQRGNSCNCSKKAGSSSFHWIWTS